MTISRTVYRDGCPCPGDQGTPDPAEGFVWVALRYPEETEIEQVQREFALPDLLRGYLEPAHKRAALEPVGNLRYAVVKTARYLPDEDRVLVGEIQLVLGAGLLISIDYDEDTLERVRRDAQAQPETLRLGPDAVLQALLGRVVADYVPVLRAIGDDVEEVEDAVFSDSRQRPTERIYGLSRQAVLLHRAIAPLAEVVESLAESDPVDVPPVLRARFRQLRSRTLGAAERADALAAQLASILQANLAQVGVQQNADNRRISAWAAIAVVPTVITGVYGMNFEHMPELTWTFGYPLALTAILATCLGLYTALRRNGWL